MFRESFRSFFLTREHVAGSCSCGVVVVVACGSGGDGGGSGSGSGSSVGFQASNGWPFVV